MTRYFAKFSPCYVARATESSLLSPYLRSRSGFSCFSSLYVVFGDILQSLRMTVYPPSNFAVIILPGCVSAHLHARNSTVCPRLSNLTMRRSRMTLMMGNLTLLVAPQYLFQRLPDGFKITTSSDISFLVTPFRGLETKKRVLDHDVPVGHRFALLLSPGWHLYHCSLPPCFRLCTTKTACYSEEHSSLGKHI
jgi:hypothetical protein